MWQKIKANLNRSLIIYLAIGLFFRLVNLEQRLFFIWDQGRDAWVLERITQGDLTLVGPTSGLPGFFLGPLWYYVGLPGYLLSGGNPFWLSVWYILLASLALGFFWKISQLLFPHQRGWALITAYLLALIPGSISGSVFIWNPLLALPLVAAGYWAMLLAKNQPKFFVLSCLLFSLALQAEFAYAIFLLPILVGWGWWWFRSRADKWRIWLAAGLVSGLTLGPQLLFEWRHQLIMTKSLLASFKSSEGQIGWLAVLLTRPQQLMAAMQTLVIEKFPFGRLYFGMILILIAWTIWQIFRAKKTTEPWQITASLFLGPLLLMMGWRGNYGNFFDYYLAPHFIFLIPLLVYGLANLSRLSWPKFNLAGEKIAPLFLGALMVMIIDYWLGSIFWVTNNAGLKKMNQAVDQVYDWMATDQQSPGVVRIFTPNTNTEHYDFLFKWQAQVKQQPVPLTIASPTTEYWYLLIEPDHQIPEKRLVPWYQTATAGGQLIRQKQVGVLTLETWQRVATAAATPILP